MALKYQVMKLGNSLLQIGAGARTRTNDNNTIDLTNLTNVTSVSNVRFATDCDRVNYSRDGLCGLDSVAVVGGGDRDSAARVGGCAEGSRGGAEGEQAGPHRAAQEPGKADCGTGGF